MAKERFNLSVPRPGAQGKTFWQNVGSLWRDDDGRMSIKLDALPVGMVSDKDGNSTPFDGWVKVFPATNDGGQGRGGGSSTPSSNRAPAGGGGRKPVPDDLSDEIPF